jgi:hypothetical protein
MPIRMSRIGLTTAGAVAAALLLAGCPTNDVDGSDLVDAIEEADHENQLTQEQLDCARDRFDDELEQDERNDVAEASEEADIDDLPESVRTTYESIMSECIAGEPPTEESTSTTAAGEGGEPSEESSTTTAAE